MFLYLFIIYVDLFLYFIGFIGFPAGQYINSSVHNNEVHITVRDF